MSSICIHCFFVVKEMQTYISFCHFLTTKSYTYAYFVVCISLFFIIPILYIVYLKSIHEYIHNSHTHTHILIILR